MRCGDDVRRLMSGHVYESNIRIVYDDKILETYDRLKFSLNHEIKFCSVWEILRSMLLVNAFSIKSHAII